MKDKGQKACSCCGIFFRTEVCPQCYVAGCLHRGKGKPCRLNSDTQKTRDLSEFQVREAYASLREEHRKLTQEAQRLVRILYAKDPTLLESFPLLADVIPGQKFLKTGQAEFPPQPPITEKPRGELQHG